MANRDMNHMSFSFEKARCVVTARISFGAVGAPTLDGLSSKGVLGVTRNSAGNYTIQFGVNVNSINYLDGYNKMLALEWQPDVSYIAGAAPAAVGQPAIYRTDLLTGMSLAAPTGGAAAAVGSGGTFAAGTYFWVVTAVDSNGNESLPSAEFSQTLVLNGSATLTWAAVPGASSYRVYRGASAGAENVVYTGIAAIASPTYTDTNAASQASAVAPVVQARPPIKANSITVQTLNGSGVATDPANGEAVYVQFDLSNSGAL